MSDEETRYDTQTGEVLPPAGNEPGGYAQDGRPLPASAVTGGDIINMLEEGQFSQDVHEAVRDLLITLNDVTKDTGNKAKGSITIKLDFEKEDSAIRVKSNFTVKKPELPRVKSIMWTDGAHNLTAFPPQQMQMFGMRSVGGSGGLRRA